MNLLKDDVTMDGKERKKFEGVPTNQTFSSINLSCIINISL